MYIPVILGTAREGRESEKAAKFMLEETKKFGFETELIDARDHLKSATDNSSSPSDAKTLSEKFSRADGFIVVSPEYNHGYPGELKMLLDTLYNEYARKPIGICGVSGGGLGGARVVEQLRLVAIELHLVPIQEAIYFSGIRSLFDENGKIKDNSYYERVKKFLEELNWYAAALKKAREEK